MTSGPSYPALISVPRITTLLASTLVSLASGTNYTFSAWAPQLGARLGLSHTQLNVIAQASITGAYMSGPVWGKIVDARGPRILLASAAVFLLSGFLGIRKLFDDGVYPRTSLTTFCFGVLIACKFGTGVAANAGNLSSINATAKTFPDNARATVTGIVNSALGLSAFLFSTISHMLFPGDTSSFLLLLAFGTAIPMVIGFFLVRPIPLPPSVISTADHNDEVDAATVPVLLQHERESRPLLSEHSDGSYDSYRSVSRHSIQEYCDGHPNVYGLKLLRTPKFWLLFSLLSMLAGTGLMYSHNVGAMSRALYAHGHLAYNEVEAQKWQAVQVSTFSITSFAGRIIIGLLSDLVKTWLLWPRSYCLVLSSLTLLTSQYVAICINSPENLWIASGMVGLGYGSIFPLFSAVCIEWFGLPHFSENWGYATTSPLISGSLFAIAFGRNLDAHQPVLGDGPSGKMCLEGNACYVDALYMTMSACALCLGLSFYAAWTDQKKLKVAGGK